MGIKQWVGSCVATIGQSGESLCERHSGVRLGPAACCRRLPREAEDGMTMSVYSTVRDV